MTTMAVKDKTVMKKQIEKEPQLANSGERISKSVLNVFRSPYTRLVLIIICLAAAILCLISMYRLSEKLNQRLTEEAEKNAANLALMEKRLIGRTIEAEQNILAALAYSSEESIRVVRSLDENIHGLLEAQLRRTMESFYREDVLTTERREAADAFNAGLYVTANQLYGEIARAHPADQEARFYQYYSLFLINKMDRNNYRVILDAMTLLERQGYSRMELTETLTFITGEIGTNGEPNQ